jgi:hypothetical protein
VSVIGLPFWVLGGGVIGGAVPREPHDEGVVRSAGGDGIGEGIGGNDSGCVAGEVQGVEDRGGGGGDEGGGGAGDYLGDVAEGVVGVAI